MFTLSLADVITALAVLSLASAGIGAWLEYLATSIHHHHDKRHR